MHHAQCTLLVLVVNFEVYEVTQATHSYVLLLIQRDVVQFICTLRTEKAFRHKIEL